MTACKHYFQQTLCFPQVNHSPSFSTDTPLDMAIKSQLILDTLDLVRLDAKQLRKGKAADKQQAAERLLRAKGRATCDQPSAVSLEEMQSIRSGAQASRTGKSTMQACAVWHLLASSCTLILHPRPVSLACALILPRHQIIPESSCSDSQAVAITIWTGKDCCGRVQVLRFCFA